MENGFPGTQQAGKGVLEHRHVLTLIKEKACVRFQRGQADSSSVLASNCTNRQVKLTFLPIHVQM